MDTSNEVKKVNKLIGQTYKRLRTEKGLTQDQISEFCDISNEYISKFENGKYNISIYNMIKMCKAIKISPNDLLKIFFEDDIIK